jgi:hypothetical protein
MSELVFVGVLVAGFAVLTGLLVLLGVRVMRSGS